MSRNEKSDQLHKFFLEALGKTLQDKLGIPVLTMDPPACGENIVPEGEDGPKKNGVIGG